MAEISVYVCDGPAWYHDQSGGSVVLAGTTDTQTR